MRTIAGLLAIVLVCAGCTVTKQADQISLSPSYVANEQRTQVIRNGMSQIVTGMTSGEVEAILGKPDAIDDVFRSAAQDAKPVGFSHWYFVKGCRTINAYKGPYDAVYVVLRFGLDGTVEKVGSRGL
jgi:hypothetical protein